MRPNTASGARQPTVKQLLNLEKYGALNVRIIETPERNGTVNISHGKDGKPDLEYLECTAEQAEEIAAHLKKIGWSKR